MALVLLTDHPDQKEIFDDDRVYDKVFFTGQFVYTTVLGAEKTIPKYRFLERWPRTKH